MNSTQTALEKNTGDWIQNVFKEQNPKTMELIKIHMIAWANSNKDLIQQNTTQTNLNTSLTQISAYKQTLEMTQPVADKANEKTIITNEENDERLNWNQEDILNSTGILDAGIIAIQNQELELSQNTLADSTLNSTTNTSINTSRRHRLIRKREILNKTLNGSSFASSITETPIFHQSTILVEKKTNELSYMMNQCQTPAPEDEDSASNNKEHSNAEQNQDGDNHDRYRTKYKTTVQLTPKAAVDYKESIILGNEISKYKKIKDIPYRAFIKDEKLHIFCWDEKHDQLFNEPWDVRAFNQGIIKILEKEDPTHKPMRVFAMISHELQTEELEIMRSQYSIEKDGIRQIRDHNFLLEFKDKDIYEQTLRLGSLQIATEPIRIYPYDSRNRRQRVVQCFKCQKYGHYTSYCNAKSHCCRYCAEPHSSDSCTRQMSPEEWKCGNCETNNNHKAGTPQCLKHALELERLKTKANAAALQKNDKMASKEFVKKTLDEYTDVITSYAKYILYDKHCGYKKISEFEKEYFKREIKTLVTIDPIESEDPPYTSQQHVIQETNIIRANNPNPIAHVTNNQNNFHNMGEEGDLMC